MSAARRIRRILCRAVYLLPLLLGILFLIYMHVPHVWFIYDDPQSEGELYVTPTTSTAQLQRDTWESSVATLESDDTATDGEQESAKNDRSFATLMIVASVVYYAAILLYAIPATLSAICSIVAFALPPTHLYANRAKRLLHFLCPNRICLLLSFFFPVLTALFPQILLFGYQTYLNLNIQIYYLRLTDWLLTLLIMLTYAAVFWATLSWQAEERLDLFRIYKSRDTVARRGEETV